MLVRLGDVFELSTPAGLVYLQLLFKHRQHGLLVAVFDEAHSARPEPIKAAVTGEPSELLFLPLLAELRAGGLARVGCAPLPRGYELGAPLNEGPPQGVRWAEVAACSSVEALVQRRV